MSLAFQRQLDYYQISLRAPSTLAELTVSQGGRLLHTDVMIWDQRGLTIRTWCYWVASATDATCRND